jgi:hypothetical protein
MYLGKGFKSMLLSCVFIFILYITGDAYGTLNFQIDPTGGGTIDITSCSEGTCSPAPPITCPANCSLTCQAPNTQGFCEANYVANANPGYVFLGFDICGQPISPEQNPWVSGWSEQDEPPCTITAHFQRQQVVPTINEWGMIIFMVVAGLGAVYYMRRRKTTEN